MAAGMRMAVCGKELCTCLCVAFVIQSGCGYSRIECDYDCVMNYADVNLAHEKISASYFYNDETEITAYIASTTCQYILHQHIVHNAFTLFMLIATCYNITAIGNKTGNTMPMVEANYT